METLRVKGLKYAAGGKKGVNMCHKLAEKWKKGDARRILGEGKEKQESPGKFGRVGEYLSFIFSLNNPFFQFCRSAKKRKVVVNNEVTAKSNICQGQRRWSIALKSTCCF